MNARFRFLSDWWLTRLSATYFRWCLKEHEGSSKLTAAWGGVLSRTLPGLIPGPFEICHFLFAS